MTKSAKTTAPDKKKAPAPVNDTAAPAAAAAGPSPLPGRDITDWHTHRPDAKGAIINLPSVDAPVAPGLLYSIGIHPWEADKATPAILAAIANRAAQEPAIVAIGEAGIDRDRGPKMSLQTAVFEAHARIAELTGKPLIVHAVRTIPEIISMHKKVNPRMPWIIHGFRSGADAARQLMARPGIYISIGEKYNPAILSEVAPWRLLHETD